MKRLTTHTNFIPELFWQDDRIWWSDGFFNQYLGYCTGNKVSKKYQTHFLLYGNEVLVTWNKSQTIIPAYTIFLGWRLDSFMEENLVYDLEMLLNEFECKGGRL